MNVGAVATLLGAGMVIPKEDTQSRLIGMLIYIAGVVSLIGGIVGQEIVKAISARKQ